MFPPSKNLPPPPSGNKSRNESLASSMPSYRNRPTSNATSSTESFSFANTKSLFESLNNPAVRSGIVNIAKNPTVQRTAVAAAKNEQVRSAAVSAMQNPQARDAVISTAQSPSNRSSILGLAKQFERLPVMGLAHSKPQETPLMENSSSSMWSQSDSTQNHLNAPQRSVLYPSLTGDPYNNKSHSQFYTDDLMTPRCKSTEPDPNSFLADLFPAQPKKPPARPPPPKVGSASIPNLSTNRTNDWSSELTKIENWSNSGRSNAPPPTLVETSWSTPPSSFPPISPAPLKTETWKTSSPITEPHALVKYPYKSDHHDELNCQPNDTVLLKREVDDSWIFATNTRTGESGIVPISFLSIKVPLVPTSTAKQSQPTALRTSVSDYTGFSTNTKNIARAIFDYNTGVDGDLSFRQGDLITVIERIDTEWLRGECNHRRGIFPLNFVHVDNLDSIPMASKFDHKFADNLAKLATKVKTVTALYGFCSGVEGDLVFEPGDVIQVLEEFPDSDWIKGSVDGRSGLVPLTYVQQNND